MNKGLFLFLSLMLSFVLNAAEVTVYNLSPLSDLSWTIVNAEGHVEYTSVDFAVQDSCFMELSDDQHYSWNLEVADVVEDNTVLLTLAVNGAVIIAVQNDVILGESVCPFVTGFKEPVMKIVGGSSVNIEDYPWQIYLKFGDYMCGGTIIADHWILTAAHCTQDDNHKSVSTSDMSVRVGTSNPYNGTGKEYNVKSYTIHDNYNTSTLSNDIAVLELEEDIDFTNAEPIELISSFDILNGASDPGVISTVTGWGITRGTETPTNTDFPSILQMVQLPILDNQVAGKVWSNVISSMLMAGYEDGNKDACSGDSGGPLTVDVDGKTKVAGIVSYGSSLCNTYGGYTRVSSFLDWIEDKTGVVPGNLLTFSEGDSLVCYGTAVSTYITSNGDSGTYEWTLSPDSVGTLSYNENEASITWVSDFDGEATLSVRGKKEGELLSWTHLDIYVVPQTILNSFIPDSIICENDLIVLSVDAAGYDLSYTWYKDDDFYRTTSDPQLVILFADTLHSGSYKCIISGYCGDVTTPNMQLTVLPNTRISKNKSNNVSVFQNEDVKLEVNATGDQLRYQWYKDSLLLEGEESKMLQINTVNAKDIGQYYALVSGTCLSDTTDAIYVYVDYDHTGDNNARIWPTVTSQILNVAISTNYPFSVKVYNTLGVLVFQGLNYEKIAGLDMSSLSDGLYLVEVESESIKEVFRFFKTNN